MGITPEEKDKLIKAAEDEQFMRSLLADPVAAAAKLGITLPPEVIESFEKAAEEVRASGRMPDEFNIYLILIIWRHRRGAGQP